MRRPFSFLDVFYSYQEKTYLMLNPKEKQVKNLAKDVALKKLSLHWVILPDYLSFVF